MAKGEMPATAAVVTKFTKGQLTGAARYQNRRDLLQAVLKDDMKYSHEEVEKIIADYMKGKVK